jgi:hypothetical protein
VCATAPSYTPRVCLAADGGVGDGRRVRYTQCIYASVDAYATSQHRAGPQVPQRVQPIDPDELSAGELGQWRAAHTTAPSLLTASSPHPAHRPNHFLKVRRRLQTLSGWTVAVGQHPPSRMAQHAASHLMKPWTIGLPQQQQAAWSVYVQANETLLGPLCERAVGGRVSRDVDGHLMGHAC